MIIRPVPRSAQDLTCGRTNYNLDADEATKSNDALITCLPLSMLRSSHAFKIVGLELMSGSRWEGVGVITSTLLGTASLALAAVEYFQDNKSSPTAPSMSPSISPAVLSEPSCAPHASDRPYPTTSSPFRSAIPSSRPFHVPCFSAPPLPSLRPASSPSYSTGGIDSGKEMRTTVEGNMIPPLGFLLTALIFLPLSLWLGCKTRRVVDRPRHSEA